MTVVDMSTRELRSLQSKIADELTRRQEILQLTCEHSLWTSIMYMRPGATYIGCTVCGIAKSKVDAMQGARRILERRQQEQQKQQE